jgi:DNA-binding NarL/FixJ family response regulator
VVSFSTFNSLVHAVGFTDSTVSIGVAMPVRMKTRLAPCSTAKPNAAALPPLTKCARVVIADPSPLFLRGLTTVLEAQPDFRIVAHCADGASCIKAIRKFLPDIAILDVSLPDISGLEILASVTSSEGLPTRVVFFTELDERELRLFDAVGVHAIIRKDADPHTLVQSLRQVASGQTVLRQAAGGGAEKAITVLTARERQILRLVSEGLSNKAIGRRLNVRDGTVKGHLHNIFDKLLVVNRTALAALYLNHGSGNQGKEPDHE